MDQEAMNADLNKNMYPCCCIYAKHTNAEMRIDRNHPGMKAYSLNVAAELFVDPTGNLPLIARHKLYS
jgi:hypothetical protein